MEQQQSHQEENDEMINMNIQKFLQTARAYLFELMPVQQPALATIPVSTAR